MLGLSVKALKSPYLQEDLFKEAFKSKFLMSICLRSKGFKVHVQVKQMSSSQVSNNYYYHFYYYYYQLIYLFFVEV